MDRNTLLSNIKAAEVKRDALMANLDKAEDIQAVKSHNADIKKWQAQIDLIDETEGLKSWGSEAVGRPLLPNATKDAEVLGFTNAGHDLIGLGGDSAGRKAYALLEQAGEGIYGAKTWQEINSPAYKQAFVKYLRVGERGLGADALKDLSNGYDTQGGYLAPPEWIARIIARTPAPTRVAGLVTNITTGRDTIIMPKVNYNADDIYSTGYRVTWTGEFPASDTAAKADDSNMFGQHRIDVHTALLTTALTRDMVEDNAFDIVGWVSGKLSETADLLADNMALSGTGVGQPFGMLNQIGSGADDIQFVVSGHASQLTPNGLIGLDYALPEQYITSSSLAYVMNRTNGAQAVAKLVDAQNRYLFRMGGAADGGLQGKFPDALLGKNIAYSAFMPNVAANAFPILFGDLSGYIRAMRTGLSIQVLQETGAKQNKIELVARLRFGGKTVEPFKLKAQKVST